MVRSALQVLLSCCTPNPHLHPALFRHQNSYLGAPRPKPLTEACESVPHAQHDASLQRPARTCSPRPSLPSPAECCINQHSSPQSDLPPHVHHKRNLRYVSMTPSLAAQCLHLALFTPLLPPSLDTKVNWAPLLPAQPCHGHHDGALRHSVQCHSLQK